MATIKDVLGVEKIYETIKSAKGILSKLVDNPRWEDTFENEKDKFKRTHSDDEYVALQAAFSSYKFLGWGNEILAIPISEELLAKSIGTCDINQKSFPLRIIDTLQLPF